MGNRFSKTPSVTRDDETRTIRFPAPRLAFFKRIAKSEGASFNAWILAAAEAYAEGAAARLRKLGRALKGGGS
jgi:hypothetical protein